MLPGVPCTPSGGMAVVLIMEKGRELLAAALTSPAMQISRPSGLSSLEHLSSMVSTKVEYLVTLAV